MEGLSTLAPTGDPPPANWIGNMLPQDLGKVNPSSESTQDSAAARSIEAGTTEGAASDRYT